MLFILSLRKEEKKNSLPINIRQLLHKENMKKVNKLGLWVEALLCGLLGVNCMLLL